MDRGFIMATHISSPDRFELRRASWGSIIGGVVTVLALSILFSFLGTALGFGLADPLADEPLDGVGTAFGIWSAIALLLSLGFGGFVAGRLAGRSGFAHGFLVWSTALLLAAVLSGMAIGTAVRATGSVIGSVFSAAGSVASGVGSAAAGAGSAAASGASGIAQWASEEWDIDVSEIDGEEVEREIVAALRDTDAASLQPEYLQQQLEEARDDVRGALRRLRADPTEFDTVAGDLVERLRGRVDDVAEDVDRDAAVNVLVENTELSREEAEAAADRLIARFERARDTARRRLDQAQQGIEEAREQLQVLEQRAREQAAAASDAIARSALWAFFALLIGALVSGGAGLLGSRWRDREDRTAVETVPPTYPPPTP